jgi:hypothetical protein
MHDSPERMSRAVVRHVPAHFSVIAAIVLPVEVFLIGADFSVHLDFHERRALPSHDEFSWW